MNQEFVDINGNMQIPSTQNMIGVLGGVLGQLIICF